MGASTMVAVAKCHLHVEEMPLHAHQLVKIMILRRVLNLRETVLCSAIAIAHLVTVLMIIVFGKDLLFTMEKAQMNCGAW